MAIKVSVIIPVYNCDRFIKDAIDSVLKQDYQEFELLVIDNCSTDKTVEYVKSYNDPRIKLIQNDTNIGMLGNWNKALHVANGEYIKLLPADDYLLENCLRLQTEVLEKDIDKKIALVCGRKLVIDDNGKILFKRGFSKKVMNVSGFDAINRTVRSGGNIIGEPGAVMFRKEIIEKCGLFEADIFYVLDLNMWFKMLVHGNLYSLPDVICAFRISTVSESIKQIGTQKRDVDNFFKKVFENKFYRLSNLSYKIGLTNSFLFAQAKKVLYKFVIK